MKKLAFSLDKYKILALFFFGIQILIIIRNIYDSYINFFWFCDFTPILIAIGFWKKDNALVQGIVNVIFLPQMVYLSGIILGTFIYPLTNFNYMVGVYGTINPLGNGIIYLIITIFTHLTGLISFIYLINEKGQRKSLKYSAIFIILVLLVTVIFTNVTDNINYVYSFGTEVLDYLIWAVIVFFVLAVPTYKLQNLLYWILGRGRKYFTWK